MKLRPSKGELRDLLASTIRDHAHFQRLITESDPSMRQEFYDSVRPHLKFRAKPLDVYVNDAGLRKAGVSDGSLTSIERLASGSGNDFFVGGLAAQRGGYQITGGDTG